VANLRAAQIARHVESAGGTACAFESSARAIQVYDPAIDVVDRSSSPGACDALLAIAPWADRIPPRWVAALPQARRLPAHLPGLVRFRIVPPSGGPPATAQR
jgi:hypothetical protein